MDLNNSNKTLSADIFCNYCDNVAFIINTKMNYFNLTCSNCDDAIVHTENTQNVLINCIYPYSCKNMYIYGKTDESYS